MDVTIRDYVGEADQLSSDPRRDPAQAVTIHEREPVVIEGIVSEGRRMQGVHLVVGEDASPCDVDRAQVPSSQLLR